MAELFNITHDAENLDEYDVTVIDGGDLSAETPGLAGTTARMEALIDDATAIYGQVNQTAPGSDQIRIRYYIDNTALSMANNDAFQTFGIVGDGSPVEHLKVHHRLKGDGSSYTINFQVIDDVPSWTTGANHNITVGEHWIEVLWVRASSDIAGDGYATLWIDGVFKETIGSLDNFDVWTEMTSVRMGMVGFRDAGTTGTLYLDELLANDDGSEIGSAPKDTGKFEDWITQRIAFQNVPPKSGSTGDFEGWITDRIYWEDYVEGAIPIVGEVTWGHDQGVIEANIRDFAVNWTGTGAISGGGDAETLDLETAEYMISEVVNTGTDTVSLFQNLYDITGDDVDMDYRHGATTAACKVAGWNHYTVPFTSLGYVQIRSRSVDLLLLESGDKLLLETGDAILLE